MLQREAEVSCATGEHVNCTSVYEHCAANVNNYVGESVLSGFCPQETADYVSATFGKSSPADKE
jgi:hypothetical protein